MRGAAATWARTRLAHLVPLPNCLETDPVDEVVETTIASNQRMTVPRRPLRRQSESCAWADVSGELATIDEPIAHHG